MGVGVVKLRDDVRDCLADAGRFGRALVRKDLFQGTKAARLSAVAHRALTNGIAVAQRRALDVVPRRLLTVCVATVVIDPARSTGA
jgi:hypothetical protein